MHNKQFITAGEELKEGARVLVMLHGRGGSAEDILSLGAYFNLEGFTLLAPQAANHTWYPYSFLAARKENEPSLSSALSLLEELLADLKSRGIRPEDIFFLGFSQGACLAMEFVTQHAARYGGLVAFTGGLIGDAIDASLYKGDFAGMPVFIGTGDPDPHVPLKRVEDSAALLKKMNAAVTVKVYPNRPHTITQDEINEANKQVFKS